MLLWSNSLVNKLSKVRKVRPSLVLHVNDLEVSDLLVVFAVGSLRLLLRDVFHWSHQRTLVIATHLFLSLPWYYPATVPSPWKQTVRLTQNTGGWEHITTIISNDEPESMHGAPVSFLIGSTEAFKRKWVSTIRAEGKHLPI